MFPVGLFMIQKHSNNCAFIVAVLSSVNNTVKLTEQL